MEPYDTLQRELAALKVRVEVLERRVRSLEGPEWKPATRRSPYDAGWTPKRDRNAMDGKG